MQADANVFPTTVFATGEVGTVSVSGLANVFPTTVFATGEVGTVSVSGLAYVYPTTVAATGEVGDVTVLTAISVIVCISGVECLWCSLGRSGLG